MRNAREAGKRPAAANLATQVQSRTLRYVANCPFCSYERRGISLNVGIVSSARELYPDGLTVEIHKHPDQQLFLFGGNVPSGQACGHLVLMWGTCAWCTSIATTATRQAVEFDFEHPALNLSDLELEVYLKEQVVPRCCDRRFMPATLVRCRKVNKTWHEPASGKNHPRDFHLTASIYFAVDPVRLYEELAVKHAAYQQHCAAAEKAGKR